MTTGARRNLAPILLSSAVVGFSLGVAYADLQWAVEHAQVLAGVVNYPAGDPLRIIQSGSWSLVSQLIAVALRLGLTEPQLSWLVSGLLGALSCQAITAVVYALSGRALLSLGSLFVIIVSRAVDWGAVYPITLYGAGYTYGIVSLSLAVLSLALAGTGAWRTSVFLAVLLVGVHAPLGLFLWLVLAGTITLDARRAPDLARQRLRQAIWPFSAGLGIVAASFLTHRMMTPPAPPVTPDALPYLRAFVTHWDMHRQPIGWSAQPVRIVAGLFIASFAWTGLMRSRVSDSARFMLVASGIAAVLGLVAVGATQIPAEAQPDWLIALMPGRFVNLPLILAAPILFGLTATLPGRRGTIGALLFAVLLLASRRSLLWTALFGIPIGSSEQGFDQLSMLGLALVGLLVYAWMLARTATKSVAVPKPSIVLRALLAAVILVAVGVTGVMARRELGRREHVGRDFRNDDLFRAIAGATRVAMAGDAANMIQLRSRTPLLLDVGTLDVLPYHAWAFPRAAAILRDIYGVDLREPPAGLVAEGRLPGWVTRPIWEAYSREDWRRFRREYGITHVVTDGGWQIKLPSLMMGRGLQVFLVE